MAIIKNHHKSASNGTTPDPDISIAKNGNNWDLNHGMLSELSGSELMNEEMY